MQRQTTWRVDGDPSIEAMRDSAMRTWQRMEVEFDGFVGPVSSFRPGADYPEVYIRDISTVLRRCSTSMDRNFFKGRPW